jgi:Zn-dependent protease
VDINLAQVFISFLVLVFSLTVHESAHAWAADRLGDPSACASEAWLPAPISSTVWTVLGITLLLAIFNMLPIPPPDGGTVLAGLLPERLAAGFDRLRPYGFLLLYALLLSGGFSLVVGTPYRYLMSWPIQDPA